MSKRVLAAILAFAAFAFASAEAAAQTAFAMPVTRSEKSYYGFDAIVTVRSGERTYHAGIDYYCSDLKALAANCGVVVKIIYDGSGDHGFGNTVIVEHTLLNGSKIYSVYAHLASFAPGIAVGRAVLRGDRVGTIGRTGTGAGKNDHLHFELKMQATLANPAGFGQVAAFSRYAYMPINAGNATAASATAYGYQNPNLYYGRVQCRCSS